MSDQCRFIGKNNECVILTVGSCDGYNERCKFRKTEKEYTEAKNKAIELNQAKGNCDNCVYMKKPCKIEK